MPALVRAAAIDGSLLKRTFDRHFLLFVRIAWGKPLGLTPATDPGPMMARPPPLLAGAKAPPHAGQAGGSFGGERTNSTPPHAGQAGGSFGGENPHPMLDRPAGHSSARYYEPLCHPKAPGLSLTGLRLVVADRALGLPVFRALSLCTCCRHYPGAASGRITRSFHPDVAAFPERVVGSACALSFSRLARRSLALRPAHSRCHQFVTRYPKASAISSPP